MGKRKQMIYIGIDPGLTGAVAIINDDKVSFIDMPTMPKSGFVGKMIDGNKLYCSIFISIIGEQLPNCCVEQVASMPAQGVSSVFSLGHSCGVIDGVLGALGISQCYVRPQEWKRWFGLIGEGKPASIAKALELYPNADIRLKKHHGRADALLIAHWIKETE